MQRPSAEVTNKKPAKECAILDTCVLMLDADVISRANAIGFPVITKTILDELDYQKKKQERQPEKDNIKRIFQWLKNVSPEPIACFPDGTMPKDGDQFFRYDLNGAFLFLISRMAFGKVGNNDSKIRQVARDYDFILVTRDGPNKVAAELEGIRAVIWTPNNPKRPKEQHDDAQGARKAENSIPKVKPFQQAASVSTISDEIIPTSRTAASGEIAILRSSGKTITLGESVGKGGEGEVFRIQDSTQVAKIYFPEKITKRRLAKLELMTSRDIIFDGICWPKDLLSNAAGDFIGYTMPAALGQPLQKSVFTKPLLEKKFPNWDRKNLVNICISFLRKIEFLHSINVLVGDINPLNCLVNGDGSDVYFVDVDSYQIEGFPCPVGTVNFSAPEVLAQGEYSKLKTKEAELFSVATMLFMILLPGKPPYSQQGGESQAQNIIQGEFPYPFGEEHRSKNVASGPWRFIWSHLPFRVKEAFHQTFKEGKRHPISFWLPLLTEYRRLLEVGYTTTEIFPTGLKIAAGDAVDAVCSETGCGKAFKIHKQELEQKQLAGRRLVCPQCARTNELKRLAISAQTAAREQGRLAAKPTVASSTQNGGWPWPKSNASSRTSRQTSPTSGGPSRASKQPNPNPGTAQAPASKAAGLVGAVVLLGVVGALVVWLKWLSIPVILFLLWLLSKVAK